MSARTYRCVSTGISDKTRSCGYREIWSREENTFAWDSGNFHETAFALPLSNSFSFENIFLRSRENPLTEYSFPVLGMRRILHGLILFPYSANASRKRRLILFLSTLFPYFFPTQTVYCVSFAGKYTSVTVSENARFPLLNTFSISLLFLRRKQRFPTFLVMRKRAFFPCFCDVWSRFFRPS